MLTVEQLDQVASRIVRRLVDQLGHRLEPQAHTRGVGTAATVPRTWSCTTSTLNGLTGGAVGGVGVKVQLSGRWLTSLLAGADAGAIVEVAFGDDQGDNAGPTAASTVPVTATSWFPLAPGGKVSAPGGTIFSCFRVRMATGTLTTGTRRVILAADVEPGGQSSEEAGRYPNVTPTGGLQAELNVLDGGGTPVPIQGATVVLGSSAAPAVAGHVAGQPAGTMATIETDATGRQNVNPIVGQTGVQGAAGVVTALTQRVAVATDDAVSTSLVALAGRDLNAGTAGGGTPRVAPSLVLTGAATTVPTASAASTQVVAANARRKRCTLRNNTLTAGADLYFAVGVAAVAGVGPVINPGQSWDVEAVGAISVIRAGATDVSVGAYDEGY